jgi:transposase
MCKLGNRKVRHVLYLAAMTATRYPGPLKDAYEAMVARGKNRKSALGAVMRRMLLLMRALLVSEADHQATGKPRPAA